MVFSHARSRSFTSKSTSRAAVREEGWGESTLICPVEKEHRGKQLKISKREKERPSSVAAFLLPGYCQFFGQNFARFRLYRRRSLQVNTRFTAFFKIYQILKLKFLKFDKIKNFANFATCAIVCWNFTKIAVFSNRFFAKILRLQRCKRMQIL